jgi:hypothetical protein
MGNRKRVITPLPTGTGKIALFSKITHNLWNNMKLDGIVGENGGPGASATPASRGWTAPSGRPIAPLTLTGEQLLICFDLSLSLPSCRAWSGGSANGCQL